MESDYAHTTNALLRVTPYPDVNDVLALLLDGVRSVLRERLVGVYLYGSLSQGGFDPGSSDIDFLVVIDDVLPNESLIALGAMHARIGAQASQWASRLEGSYMPRAAVRRFDETRADFPSIGVDWKFGIEPHDISWVLNLHVIRELGLVLWGPPPDTLIDPITPETLVRAVKLQLRVVWQERSKGPDWLRPREYQAFAILTMCRALYALDHGGVTVTKPAAAAWASKALPPRWTPLIERALARRYDHADDDMEEMLRFVRYAVERAKE